MPSAIFHRHPLARDITVVMAIKVALITVASIYLFPHDQRPVVTVGSMEKKLLGPVNAGETKPMVKP